MRVEGRKGAGRECCCCCCWLYCVIDLSSLSVQYLAYLGVVTSSKSRKVGRWSKLSRVFESRFQPFLNDARQPQDDRDFSRKDLESHFFLLSFLSFNISIQEKEVRTVR